MCPEDVSLVLWNVLHKFVVFELTQLFACQFEVIDVDVFETEFFDGPLYPVTHMSDVPRLGIYRDSQQTQAGVMRFLVLVSYNYLYFIVIFVTCKGKEQHFC